MQEVKKKYDKETEKYCSVLEKHMNLSSKKKEVQLHEVRGGLVPSVIFFFVITISLYICTK